MNYYSLEIEIRKASEEFGSYFDPKHTTTEEIRKDWGELLCALNEQLCSEEDADKRDGKRLLIAVYKGIKGCMFAVAAAEFFEEDRKMIEAALQEEGMGCELHIKSMEEITLGVFRKHIEQAGNADNIAYTSKSYILDGNRLDYKNNYYYKMQEKLCPAGKMDKAQVLEHLKKRLADKSMLEEIERIYDPSNMRGFYGNPVHYHMKGTPGETSADIICTFVSTLYSAGRLTSRRISFVNEIKEELYDEEELEYMFDAAKGGTVVINTRGSADEHDNFASAYAAVVEFIAKLILQYQQETLFIIFENDDTLGFSASLVSQISREVRIIDIKEGSAESKEEAIRYLDDMSNRDRLKDLITCDFGSLIEEGKTYRPADLSKIYHTWYLGALRNDIYKAYKDVAVVKADKSDNKMEAYQQLQRMIGLTEIKTIVDEIISTAKMQKLRSKAGLKKQDMSLHMIFTGNPGSAKTTVARRIAEILKDEGVLRTGAFVECGRDDLVSKYVGWTAINVAGKFEEASGGILFIDEAYSLVDDSNSFGTEAINTIVKYMEGMRDDVICVFAGYPQKMKKFLENNEGLRSRIAFHLNFPDYTADELVRILDVMVEDRGYSISTDARKKCYDMFSAACRNPDFGNGRYVRNTLEQSIMRQSRRLYDRAAEDITKEQMMALEEEDFAASDNPFYKTGKAKKYGF